MAGRPFFAVGFRFSTSLHLVAAVRQRCAKLNPGANDTLAVPELGTSARTLQALRSIYSTFVDKNAGSTLESILKFVQQI